MAIKSIPNESFLLSEVAKGNQKCFAELFYGYHNQLAKYILMLTSSETMTEDIIQDIFVKIWANKEGLPAIANFPSYLFILTRNYTLNSIRKAVKENQNQQNYTVQLLRDELNEPVSVLDEYQYQALIDKAVNHLSPQLQKVYWLKVQGLKSSEIAEKLGLSQESVRKYVQRALKALSDFIKAHIELVLFFETVNILKK